MSTDAELREVLPRLEAVRVWADYALQGHVAARDAIAAGKGLLDSAELWSRAA